MGMLAAEAGLPAPAATCAATNGRTVAVSRMGPPIHWKRQEGLEGPPPEGALDPSSQELQRVAEALKSFRAILVATGVGRPDWTEVQNGAVLWVDRSLNVSQI
jgi:hypothetical protein